MIVGSECGGGDEEGGWWVECLLGMWVEGGLVGALKEEKRGGRRGSGGQETLDERRQEFSFGT